MSSLTSVPRNDHPRTIYIPKRTKALNHCWVSTRIVNSIYFGGCNVFVELNNRRTLRLVYKSNEEAERALEHFNYALAVFVSKEEADKEWPKPVDGEIITMSH